MPENILCLLAALKDSCADNEVSTGLVIALEKNVASELNKREESAYELAQKLISIKSIIKREVLR